MDDTCTVTLTTPGSSLNTLLQQTQHDAQAWNDILFTSGGRVDFQANGIPMLRHSPEQPLLLVDPPTGDTIPVKSKNIFQARRNLGHYKSPAGTQKTQFQTVLTKAQRLSQAISQCPISRESAYALYHSVYQPAVEYVLGQSFLNPAKLQTIQKKSLPWIFNKCGFAKITSRALLFGPSDIGGGGFIPLQAKAGAEYVTQFIKFWRSPHTQCGQVLRVVHSWTQLQSGMTKPILQYTDQTILYVDSRFTKALKQHLHNIQSTITVDNPSTPHPLRVGDISLMDRAISLPFTSFQLKCINAVRLHHRVTFLSEICNMQVPLTFAQGGTQVTLMSMM